jgi:hypothetical protein
MSSKPQALKLDLTAHAMLVNIHLGIWTGSKQDKGEAQDVASRHKESANSVNVIKYVVPRELLKPVEQARNAIRNHKDHRTLPWSNNGDRLLPRKQFTLFMDEHTALVEAFDAEVLAFMPKYKSLWERAQFEHRTLFNQDDFPHPDAVKRKFYCKLDISPVGTADDFRVNLNSDAVDLIKNQIEVATTERIFQAQANVWERVEKVVTVFAGRMQAQAEYDENTDGRRPALHQSTIDNMIDLVNTLPALNIVDDPKMKSVGKKLHRLLQSYNDVDQLKGKADICAQAHEEVQAILEEMAGARQ